MEQFSCGVNTRPKCFAFFPPNFVVALHLLCAFQPEMCLRTWEGSVRFSCNLYFRFFQCIFLIYVYNRLSQHCFGQCWYQSIRNFCSFTLMVFSPFFVQ